MESIRSRVTETVATAARATGTAARATAATLNSFNEKLKINKDRFIGQIISTVGLMENSQLDERKRELIKEIYDEIHGKVTYSQMGIAKYILENPKIIDKIQELMVIRMKSMGSERDIEEPLPNNINSYILVLASILVEPNPDLTYGYANVTDDELETYFDEHPLSGGRKSRRRRHKKRVKNTRKSRKSRRSYKKRSSRKRH